MLFLLGCVPAGQEEDFRIDAYFCPESDCEKVLTQNLLQASSMIHCAFYDIDDPELIDALTQKQRSIEVRIVTDGDNDKGQLLNLTYEADDENQLMHNKFCTIDGKRVVTGSLNPTESGAGVNNNNLLLIDSPILAGIYEEEFRDFVGSSRSLGAYFCQYSRSVWRMMASVRVVFPWSTWAIIAIFLMSLR